MELPEVARREKVGEREEERVGDENRKTTINKNENEEKLKSIRTKIENR